MIEGPTKLDFIARPTDRVDLYLLDEHGDERPFLSNVHLQDAQDAVGRLNELPGSEASIQLLHQDVELPSLLEVMRDSGFDELVTCLTELADETPKRERDIAQFRDVYRFRISSGDKRIDIKVGRDSMLKVLVEDIELRNQAGV